MLAYVDLHDFACLCMFLFVWVSLKLGSAVCSGSVGGYEHVCPYKATRHEKDNKISDSISSLFPHYFYIVLHIGGACV